MKRGWLVNDTLTCIPGTKTFWHDLLEWLPGLEDKTGGHTSFTILPQKIEADLEISSSPDYIIRNASYFRALNTDAPTISLLQDCKPPCARGQQIEVCRSSRVTVCNSPYTYEQYKDDLEGLDVRVIPLGVDFDLFRPLKRDACQEEMGVLPNSILFVGASTNNPKGFDIVKRLISETGYNFCLVMKDGHRVDNPRVVNFNRVSHEKLVKIMNACSVLICTSRQETLHLAGIEAAACNVPVIATNVGIYYGRESGPWGLKSELADFSKTLDAFMASDKDYSPRSYFIGEGLDLCSVRNKWTKLIEEIV